MRVCVWVGGCVCVPGALFPGARKLIKKLTERAAVSFSLLSQARFVSLSLFIYLFTFYESDIMPQRLHFVLR